MGTQLTQLLGHCCDAAVFIISPGSGNGCRGSFELKCLEYLFGAGVEISLVVANIIIPGTE